MIKNKDLSKNYWNHLQMIPIIIGTIVSYFIAHDIYFSIIYFLSMAVPHLVIHINYLRARKSINISLRNSESLLEVKKLNEEPIEIDYDKVVKVESYLSFPHFDERMYWFPWDGYNYTVIYTDNEFYVITSLNLDCLKIFLPENIPHTFKKRLYPYCYKKISSKTSQQSKTSS